MIPQRAHVVFVVVHPLFRGDMVSSIELRLDNWSELRNLSLLGRLSCGGRGVGLVGHICMDSPFPI